MYNSHLNHFQSYSREERDNQLENDLTRAFAISLIENPLFLHEVLQYIFSQNNEKDFYSKQFSNINNDSKMDVTIQRSVTSLNSPTHLFAVSVTGVKMDIDDFPTQLNDIRYDPITDLVVEVNDVAIIFEVKPNDTNCISQLYNQAFNAMLHHGDTWLSNVTPVDLCWNKLVEFCNKVMNFQKLSGVKSKILEDFIDMLRAHNSRWLPVFSLSNLTLDGNVSRVISRIYQALQQGNRTPIHSDRLGFRIDQAWAEEVLINVRQGSLNKNKEIVFSVFPGNTKAQGYHIFKNQGEPVFHSSINLREQEFQLQTGIHLKFSHFQKYFTGIDIDSTYFKVPLLTFEKFHKFSGRQYRGLDNWKYLEEIFDDHFIPSFNWRDHCGWQEHLLDSNRSYFDLSFGYEIDLILPYIFLSEIDKKNEDVSELSNLINEIGNEFVKII